MCTVTYIPAKGGNMFVLTSNRDESEVRPTVPPEIHLHGNHKLAYPKDTHAGGSWIAMNDHGKICCLFNGGIAPHTKQPYHTVSRGNVLLNYITSMLECRHYFENEELTQVEPFTIISIEHNGGNIECFTKFIWDGQKKHFKKLDKNSPYIWSSVTLYNEEQRILRKEWFVKFYKEAKDQMTPQKIYSFHSGQHTDDSSVNIVMERKGGVKTVSITQILLENQHAKMLYFDLTDNSRHELTL